MASIAAPADPFKAHFANILSLYEHGPVSGVTIPKYEGPSDVQTDGILRALTSLAQRAWAAEEGQTARSQPIGDPENAVIPENIPENIDATVADHDTSAAAAAADELARLKIQVRDAARVCTAVARGDLTQKIPVPAQGAETGVGELAHAVNTMVDNIAQIMREVTRVSLEIGTEGVMGGQVSAPDAEGAWRELTGTVNNLARNLTSQLRSIALVTKAVALGDLSKQIEVSARGEVLDLKNTVNGMVLRLRVLKAEIARATREVESQGKLSAQAHVPDAEGIWLDLVRKVNEMYLSSTDGNKSSERAVDQS